MLREAQHPVEELALVVQPTLICANIAEVQFRDGSFDLVYSIGVLGEFLSFDQYISEKIYRLLKPGGKFVFTVISQDSPRTTSWKREAVEAVLPLVPIRLKRILNARFRSLWLPQARLQSIMEETSWSGYKITPRVSATSGCKHLVCVGSKK
jgi:ubiquinone/menaquinone biosynthesis C-methylase UbiE